MKNDGIDNGREFDFGRISEDYAGYRNIYPRDMYDKLVSFGIGRKGQRILDLGSGTAVLPLNLYHTGAYFAATDISEDQIRFGMRDAKEKGMENISFGVCCAEDTGFDDSSFDIVTAAQCFQYFDAQRVAGEIYRVLRPNGLFCKIFMDWLPYEDDIIREMEECVLRYNPDWSGGGFEQFRYRYPVWAEGRFDIETVHSYHATLGFSKNAWLGRIRSCRGIGASLTDHEIAKFEQEYRGLLAKYDEPLRLKHQIHIEIYRSKKRDDHENV